MTLHRGFIHYQPMKYRTAPAYVSAFRKVCLFFSSKSFPLTNLILDNETSSQLSAFFVSQNIKFEHVPPNQPRRAIHSHGKKTAKKHFISTLASVHVSFPPNRWHALIPLAQLTLNTLRPFAKDPSRSAWHGIHGQSIDFAAHPMAIHPAGQLVVAHDPPHVRPTWARHGTRSF
jgi:hypothetical protein